ncbi:MAG: germination protein YpeB [Clostridia bacterium]|nr:germination protein YpeB [Clostridia bacterium]
MNNTKIENETKTRDNRKEMKKARRHRTLRNVMLVAVHALGVGAIVGLSVALYFSQDKIEMQTKYQNQMESVYAKAYYNLLDGVNDVDTTMAKLSVAKSEEKQEALLYEIWCASTLIEEYLATFENQDEGVRTAVKFVNQLGDYSLYLAGKLSRGESLDDNDRETLRKMRPMADALKESLKKVGTDLDGGKLFLEEDGVLESFASAFSTFSEPDFNYPEMIYDGPFSDALETRVAKGLEGQKEITAEEGATIITKLFDGATDINHIGRFEGHIPTENYSFTYAGHPAYVQLSVRGGKVVNFTLTSTTEDGDTAVSEAGQIAIDFAQKLGFQNMQVVWSATAHGHTYVNLAPVVEGIILYPDLVKVKIDGDKVVGFDSAHHAYNHRDRHLPKPAIGEDEARKNLSVTPVRSGRLALIPDGGEKETLCYEYECEAEGTYFIYIDALTGAETEILYVIDDVDMGESMM